MLSTSQPAVHHAPESLKRDRPHDEAPRPNKRMAFLVDDDSDDDNEPPSNERPTKRAMIQRPDTQEAPQEVPGSVEAPAKPTEVLPTNDSAQEAQELPPPIPAITFADIMESRERLTKLPSLQSKPAADYRLTRCNGQSHTIQERAPREVATYDTLVAARSKTKEGRAKKSYYGIDIHELMAGAKIEIDEQRQKQAEKIPSPTPTPVKAKPRSPGKKPKMTKLWTEKYRARNFMDLCGDDSTNRTVLRWLKRWDPVVFPGSTKPKPVVRRPGMQEEEEKPHRKILLLTGPPGLGKTTLAHVCAKQAGYEVMEINASDDRSRDVVKTRIRTCLGTESVKAVANQKETDGPRKIAKPACVIVDEVDGVVTGSGASGDGGFVKALIDLVMTDQRNSSGGAKSDNTKKRKGDDFRMLRPLILICNDVYAPSLKPLRQSNLAEIIHTGRPTMDAVVNRLKAIFEKEGIPCDKDASRKLCEAAWGMTSGIDAKRGAASTVEGDLRGVMVVGEWVAGRFKAATAGDTSQRLTRQWIEKNIIHDLASGAAGSRGLGRGSVKDIVSRLFQEGGGFPKTALVIAESKNAEEQPKTELGFNEYQKKHTMDRLKQMIETSGETSYIMIEVMAEYPNRDFNDDCYLNKPNQAYDWMHFHDTCQSRLYSSQDWELAPYLSLPILACHHLFASPKRYIVAGAAGGRWGAQDNADKEEVILPFTGPRADYQALEAERANRSQLQAMQSQLSPSLMRSFRSAEDMATDFMPYLARMASPDVKPVVVGGSQGSMASVRKESERLMVKRAAETLAELSIALVKGTIENKVANSRAPEFVYRLEPDIEALACFETAANLLSSQAPTRYAVRQVLDQELRRAKVARENLARQARFQAGQGSSTQVAAPRLLSLTQIDDDKENAAREEKLIKRDFFGRIIEARPLAEVDRNIQERNALKEERKVWVTFHEGLNNAVRKPITLSEFLRAL